MGLFDKAKKLVGDNAVEVLPQTRQPRPSVHGHGVCMAVVCA